MFQYSLLFTISGFYQELPLVHPQKSYNKIKKSTFTEFFLLRLTTLIHLFLQLYWQVVIPNCQEVQDSEKSFYTYFGPVSFLIQFTPHQLSVECDVIHPWFSLLFETPKVLSILNLWCIFNIPIVEPS